MLVLDETPYEEPKDALQVAPTGIVKAAGMAALKLPVDVAGAGLLVAGGLDELLFNRDNFFKLYDEELKPIQDKLTPEPGSVTAAGRFISGIAGFAPALALGPAGVPVLAAENAINTGASLVEQGVGPKAATAAGILTGATTEAMAGLPAGAKTWSKTLALAAANPIIGAASTEAEKKLLEATGNEKVAESYDPFDPVSRGIDATLGLAFGAMGKYAEARREMLTKTQDSIDTVANWQKTIKDTPFDTTDPKTADLGYKAMQQALSDISQGKNVDLSNVLPDTVQVRPPDAPQVRAEAAEAQQALTASSRAYQSLDAPTPRDIYAEQLAEKNQGQVPAEHIATISKNEDLQNGGMPSYFDAKYYEPYLKKLWDWHQETEIPVSRADLDIGHVTGMNDTLGHFETDKHLKAISEIIKTTVLEHGITDATFSRYGGDELAVEAVGVDRATLDNAVQAAKLNVDKYAKYHKLIDLVSKKNPQPKDVTLHVNTVSFGDFASYQDMRRANDAKIENRRTVTGEVPPNEQRIQTQETRPVAPAGEPAGNLRGNPENPGRNRGEAGSLETTAANPIQEIAATRAPKEVLPLTDSRRLSLETVKNYLQQGEAATRIQADYVDAAARGEVASAPWQRHEPNPFPEYFKGKGYKEKEIVAWIDKALAGEPLTEKQRSVVTDLMAEHRSKIARQFLDARQEMKGYGDLWQDPVVQNVEQRLAEGNDFPIQTGTDSLGKPTEISARDYINQGKEEYKALEAQKDIFSRISDCL